MGLQRQIAVEQDRLTTSLANMIGFAAAHATLESRDCYFTKAIEFSVQKLNVLLRSHRPGPDVPSSLSFILATR